MMMMRFNRFVVSFCICLVSSLILEFQFDLSAFVFIFIYFVVHSTKFEDVLGEFDWDTLYFIVEMFTSPGQIIVDVCPQGGKLALMGILMGRKVEEGPYPGLFEYHKTIQDLKVFVFFYYYYFY